MDAPDPVEVNSEVWDEMQAFDLGMTDGDVVSLDGDAVSQQMRSLIGPTGTDDFVEQFDQQEG